MLELAGSQHGVVTHAQLVERGLPPQGIKHRRARGKLHPIHREVFAVGRPELSRKGELLAAVLACGAGAYLSHESVLELVGVAARPPTVHVSVSPPRVVSRPGIFVHRRLSLSPADLLVRDGIPGTTLLRALIDVAPGTGAGALDDLIETAHRRDLADPATLRRDLDELPAGPGTGALRAVLDRWTLELTDSQLERRMLPIARRAGLGAPLTQQWLNGYRVDFFWPALGLVVEADSLRYHRTARRQLLDARRDQAHVAAGLTPLRFSHTQITYQPETVEETLRKVAARLRAASDASSSPGDT